MTSCVSVMQYSPRSMAADEIDRLREEITSQTTMEESQTQEQNQFEASHEEPIESPMWTNAYRG